MKRKKVKTLLHFKKGEIEGDCLTLVMAKYRKEKHEKELLFYKEKLSRAKFDSKGWHKCLGKIRKCHNKIRALYELISEVESIREKFTSVNIADFLKEFPITQGGRSDFARSCKGKVSYSKSSAMTAAENVSEKIGETLEHYKCRYCEGWHIGHSI